MKHKRPEILLQKESKIRFQRDGFSIHGLFAIDKLAGFPIIPREIREQEGIPRAILGLFT